MACQFRHMYGVLRWHHPGQIIEKVLPVLQRTSSMLVSPDSVLIGEHNIQPPIFGTYMFHQLIPACMP